MNKPEIVTNTEQQLQPYATGGRSVNWCCICPGKSTEGVQPDLYRQTGASAVGVGFDWAVAMELQARRRRCGTDMNNRAGILRAPVHILGGLAAGRLSRPYASRQAQLLTHTNCVVERQLPSLPEIVRTQPDDMFERTKRIWPILTADTFEQVADIFSALQDTGRIKPPQEAASALAESGIWRQDRMSYDWKYPAVGRVEIEQTGAAPYFLANYRQKVAYSLAENIDAGQEQTTPVYHLSIGDMAHEIGKPLSTFIDFRPEEFLAATAVRHAAVTAVLGVPSDNIHMIGQATRVN